MIKKCSQKENDEKNEAQTGFNFFWLLLLQGVLKFPKISKQNNSGNIPEELCFNHGRYFLVNSSECILRKSLL